MDVSKGLGGDHGNDLKPADDGDKSCEKTQLRDASHFMERGIFQEGPVVYLGLDYVLQLYSKGLKLTHSSQTPEKCRKSKIEDLEISWQHVITAETNASVPGDNPRRTFDLHYIEPCKIRLQARCVKLVSVNEEADVWVDIIKNNCSKVPGRPKKMLVVVNSIGGQGKGPKIYQKKVAPIFQRAQIITNVIYTERRRHSRDIGENEDLTPYDCVVVAGGDGTYQEVLHGMTVRVQKSAGVDYNDANAKMACLNKPIAIIPTGTSNCMSAAINRGVVDVETAALRILTGEIHRSQVSTIHSNGKLFSVAGLSCTFGGLNQVAQRAQELRWMGQYRYYYAALCHLFKKKEQMSLELEYLVCPNQGAKSSNESPNGSNEERSAELQWKRHDSQGKMYGNLMFSTLESKETEDSPMKNSFTNHTMCAIDMGCSTFRAFKVKAAQLNGKALNTTKIQEEDDNMVFLENIRGLRVKVLTQAHAEGGGERSKASTSHEMVNARPFECLVTADGECLQLEVPEIEVKVRPAFVPLYGS